MSDKCPKCGSPVVWEGVNHQEYRCGTIQYRNGQSHTAPHCDRIRMAHIEGIDKARIAELVAENAKLREAMERALKAAHSPGPIIPPLVVEILKAALERRIE